jgi:hypothetical protein
MSSQFGLAVVFGGGLLAAMASAGAWSAPVNVAPGANDVPVPSYTGTGTPTVKLLFDTGSQSATMDGMTVQFEEFAVETSLNPAGVSFGYVIDASNDPTSLTAALPGYGLMVGGAALMTSVESCDPFTEETTKVCGTKTGTVSRSSGAGDTLTFNGIGTTPVSLGPGETVWVSNVYGIFTNAHGWTDPSVTVTDDGKTFTFRGVGPAAASAPEPATLGLLGLGLLGTLITRRRQKPSA